MKRMFLFFFVSLISTSLFSKIIVGTLSYNPPFEYVVDNKNLLSGFDIDLMNNICKRINETCEYKTLLAKELFTETSADRIDLAIASLTITKERQAEYLFSTPYLESKYQLMTTINSPIQKAADVNGTVLGVLRGSLFKELALTLFTKITLHEVASNDELYSALLTGKVQAILLDHLMAKFWQSNNSKTVKLIGNGVLIGDGYGIMTNKNNGALINRINKAIQEMENDGTYVTLYKQYFW